MLMFVMLCERHGYIKNIQSRQGYCNGNSLDIEHLLRYTRQQLTLPIASTERGTITFKRQAWHGDIIYMIL